MSDLERTLKEVGYRCQKCRHNIDQHCEIYHVWLAHDDGCYDHYEPITPNTDKQEVTV